MSPAPPLWEPSRRQPTDLALADDRRTLTWEELEARTNAVGHGLESTGLAPGDHVLVVASNCHEFVEVLVGAMRAGMVVTPAKTGLTEEELDYVVGDAATRAVITDQPAARAVARGRKLVCLDLDDDFDRWLTGQRCTPLPVGRAGWRMPLTSGTTGRPKGVVSTTAGRVTFSSAWAASTAMARRLHLPADGWHLMASRMFHGAPLNFGLAALAAGAPMRILPAWSAEGALDALSGCSSTCMVPTMFRQLLALPADLRRRFDPGGLATVVHGGEPCPIDTKRRMIEWWGPIFLEYFGFTEGGMTLATTAEWRSRPGTVGRPTGQRVIVRGPDGSRLPPGVEGTVYFTPPDEGARDFAYRHDPEKTAAAHLPDGSFTAGDIGFVDEDGYLYISGRSSDTIVSAGVNVYPAEVEAVLLEVPGVADACVVGGPDPERGERVVAVVVAAQGVDTTALRSTVIDACSRRLAGYKAPREVMFRTEVPRDETGKLLRRVVRDDLWGERSVFVASAEN